MSAAFKPENFVSSLTIGQTKFKIVDLAKLKSLGLGDPATLPFSIKILLESVVRNCDHYQITANDVQTLLGWNADYEGGRQIAYKPARVLLQDFTGVPCVVDLAALRSGMHALGGDIRKINPQVPCDLVIDHSVQVDAYGTPEAMDTNLAREFERNQERYAFLKWGQKAFENFSVIPPATGIIHQVNLEYLAKGVMRSERDGAVFCYPDSLVGTDSHTTMINGLGIVGWGVGGIEAEAVMLGEPIYMLMPQVVGVELRGRLPDGVTATDLVLTVVERLRQEGVVGKFVEFFGEGIQHLSVPDRATLSNMGPEYGATLGIFPVDDKTLDYYRMTGRPEQQVTLIEHYMKAQGLFYTADTPPPAYSSTLRVDLDAIESSVAGPKRPQDRIPLKAMKTAYAKTLSGPAASGGFAVPEDQLDQTVTVNNEDVGHGAVVIASITSCTNTSNPSVLIGAALVAKKAVERGLTVKDYVKTSFIPGSRAVRDYLSAAGLMPYLEALKFHVVGYGCGPCIGNSGPLDRALVKAIEEHELVVASVLSGNRNFEGRVSPHTKTNYLASPGLVVAYALAGTMRIDLTQEPLGDGKDGNAVYLKDLWPDQAEINAVVDQCVTAEAFKKQSARMEQGTPHWHAIDQIQAEMFPWDASSTYIQEPPFFQGMRKEAEPIKPIHKARCLVKVGDSITTDHISPAGAIAPDSPAGQYLQALGVAPEDFNSYGSRRGNDQVMTRGTFANVRLKNQLAPGTEGSWTTHWPTDEKISIYEAGMRYQREHTPLIVLAGKEYGTGSSRDWAAKGTALLGIRVVIAQSYERIHRNNLAGMGVLPLEFMPGESAGTLGLRGDETFTFAGVTEDLQPRQKLEVTATAPKGTTTAFTVRVRLDTPVEIEYFRNGGILQTVLRKLAVS